jgi:hypothetical protein
MDIFSITSFTDVLYAMLKVLLPSFVKQGVNILQRGIVILFSSNVKSWINMFLLGGNVGLNTVLILFIPMLQVILTQVHYDCAVSLNIFYSTICFTMVSLGVVDPLITIILERIWTRVRRNPYRLNLMTQMRGTVLIFLSCNFFGFFYPSVYLLCAVACLSQYYIIKARLLLEGVKPSYLTVKDVMTVVGSIAFGSTSYLAVSFYGVTLRMFYAFGYDQRYFQIYASSGIVMVACLICLVLTTWSRCGCLGTIEDTGNTYRLSDTPSLVQNLHVYTDSRFPYQMQVYPPAHIPL